MTMRSEPSSPNVTGAVRSLPRTRQRARRTPFRVMISAPFGIDRIVCFLKTVPTVHLPFLTLRSFCHALVLDVEGQRFIDRRMIDTKQELSPTPDWYYLHGAWVVRCEPVPDVVADIGVRCQNFDPVSPHWSEQSSKVAQFGLPPFERMSESFRLPSTISPFEMFSRLSAARMIPSAVPIIMTCVPCDVIMCHAPRPP